MERSGNLFRARPDEIEVAERNLAVIAETEGKVTEARLEKPKKKLSSKIGNLWLLSEDLDVKNTADYSNILKKVAEYLTNDSMDLNDLKNSLL